MTGGSTVMRIVCASDEHYLPHFAALVMSLRKQHSPESFVVHLLHAPALPARRRAELHDWAARVSVNLQLLEVDDPRLAGLRTLSRIGPETWYRTLLPELLPTCQRVLYLDVDTLVVDELANLWQTDLAGCEVAAVSNVFEPELAAHAESIGVATSAYFNAGVLLLDLDALRRSRHMDEVLGYARGAQRLALSDQDALNVVLAPHCRLLHPRWNCQNSFFYMPQARTVLGAQALREATSDPAILHFEGPALNKPWHFLCQHPRRSLYFECRRGTPWPAVEVEGRTLANLLLKPLPMPLLVAVLKGSWRLRERVRGLLGRARSRLRRRNGRRPT